MHCVRGLLVFATHMAVVFVSPVWADHIRELQQQARETGRAAWGHWGPEADTYSSWTSHSNRLIPIYTYGVSLDTVRGVNSPYRDASRLEALYGQVPEATVNPQADYFDQTDVARVKQAAVDAGKKYVILLVFDGMDWQTTWAAAIYRSGCVPYREGRGRGLHFQDYADYHTVPADFGYFVCSPHNHGTKFDVNAQVVITPDGLLRGGYDPARGGAAPWAAGDARYLLAMTPERWHAYTDSSSSATSLCSGIKTYNEGINVDARGQQVAPIAWRLQEQGRSIGVVTSVPISHATPACAYANNVSRDDYQDLTRDLLGLPSIAHRQAPLAGVDVLIGGGWGEDRETDEDQGANFMPGNKYLAAPDLAACDVANGGEYRVVQRAAGQPGGPALRDAARDAADRGQRLFGFFGAKGGHLPYRTADGRYDPTAGARPAEQYTPADVSENPTLAEMTAAALSVLERDPEGFWLMVEAGDVDWANHDNNLDNSIGAVISGDDAFRVIADWAERRDCWDQTAVIVTADHGHMLILDQPEALASPMEADRAP
jgi:alkaline phosphatase